VQPTTDVAATGHKDGSVAMVYINDAHKSGGIGQDADDRSCGIKREDKGELADRPLQGHLGNKIPVH